ncbi:MAG: hypothetical protein ACR2N5_07155 [Solirubrobacterales bacterium]
MTAENQPGQQPEGDAAAQSPPGAGEPSEEELRQRLEEEVRTLRIQDVLLQSVVSIINLAARRIGKEDERDLEQARIGIDAGRALVDLLEPEPAQQVRQALSEIQVMYANAAGEDGAPPPAPSDPPASAPPPAPPAQGGGQGPERPPGLWTPPGT